MLAPDQIDRLRNISPQDDERHHYDMFEDELQRVYQERDENTSRQIVVAHPPEAGTKLWCFTSIQLLLWREVNSMMVTMRSSSTRRLPSDLGFISRLAKKYGCEKVRVSIGSFHVELTEL